MATRKPARAKDQQGWLLSSQPDGGASAADHDPSIVGLVAAGMLDIQTTRIADLRQAMARAIRLLEAEQWESAKAVLIEARERDQKGGGV